APVATPLPPPTKRGCIEPDARLEAWLSEQDLAWGKAVDDTLKKAGLKPLAVVAKGNDPVQPPRASGKIGDVVDGQMLVMVNDETTPPLVAVDSAGKV